MEIFEMSSIEKIRKNIHWQIIASSTLFIAILIVLIDTREAWIDESWFAAYAVQFIRTGEIADLNMARFTNILPHNYFFYFYTLLQAPFYNFFGENLIVGRMITALFSLLGVWAIYKNFRLYMNLEKVTALFFTLVIIYTYYYVYPATQIRPDLIAMVFVLVGMIFLKNWIDDKGAIWLVLTHLMFIFAMLLHLQAGFAWVGLWFFLLFNTLKIESKIKIIGISLPVYIAIALPFVFNEHFETNLHYYYNTFFGTGNMAGHKGGMILSMMQKYHEGAYLKFGIRAGILLVIVLNFLYYIYIKNIKVFLNDAFFLVAGASFGSWVLTTTQINDYHAVWLTIPFMLLSCNMTTDNKFIKYFNGTFFLLLIIPTFVYTIQTVKKNPLKQQRSDIQMLNQKYNLTHKNLFIDRDLMWFYSFGKNVTYRLDNPAVMPDYLLLRKAAHKKTPSSEFDGKAYKFIDETQMFLLYKRNG